MMNRKSFLASLSAAALAPFIWPKLPALPVAVEEPEVPPVTQAQDVKILLTIDGIDPSDPRHQRLITKALDEMLSRIPNRNLDDL